jgi:hypothetical protein
VNHAVAKTGQQVVCGVIHSAPLIEMTPPLSR